MSFQKRCGKRRRGTATEAMPFTDMSIAELDAAVTKSLKGEGKNHMAPTYGTRRFNAMPKP